MLISGGGGACGEGQRTDKEMTHTRKKRVARRGRATKKTSQKCTARDGRKEENRTEPGKNELLLAYEDACLFSSTHDTAQR